MSYLKHTGALETLAQRIISDKPVHKNVAFTHLHGLATNLRNAVEAIGKLHDTPNPTETREAHIKRITVAAGQLSNKVKETQERINSVVQQGLKDIDQRIGSKVKLVPDGYAAEIRQAFRAMSHTERINLLGQLAQENRGVELAAIIKAPALLTGINPEMQSQFEEVIISKHASEEWEERNALMESFDTALVACGVGVNAATEYSYQGKAAFIAKQEDAANQANSAFAASLSNEVQI